MNFRNLNRPALHVLADAVGRIDYAAADLEAARVKIRNAVATALLHHDAREHLDAIDKAAREADTIAQPCDGVSTAAQALLDAFGSDVPDWLRDEASALEAALLHASAPPSDDDALDAALDAEPLHPRHEEEQAMRQITLDDLGPEARTDALHAIARGADLMRYTTTGVEYYKGGILLNPEPRLPGQLPGETYQAAEDRRAADLMQPRHAFAPWRNQAD